jgi:hypothetical protein
VLDGRTLATPRQAPTPPPRPQSLCKGPAGCDGALKGGRHTTAATKTSFIQLSYRLRGSSSGRTSPSHSGRPGSCRLCAVAATMDMLRRHRIASAKSTRRAVRLRRHVRAAPRQHRRCRRSPRQFVSVCEIVRASPPHAFSDVLFVVGNATGRFWPKARAHARCITSRIGVAQVRRPMFTSLRAENSPGASC